MKRKVFLSLVFSGILLLFISFSFALANETNPPSPEVTALPPTAEPPTEEGGVPLPQGEQLPVSPPFPPPDAQVDEASSEASQPAGPTFPSQTDEGQATVDDSTAQALIEPIEAVVIRSWSGCTSDYVIWKDLNENWALYGSIPIHITYDYPGLCDGPVTHDALVASGADVLILSDPLGMSQVYSTDEIIAIMQYAMEGHHLIGTYALFQYGTINNLDLAQLFGLQSSATFSIAMGTTPTYSYLEASSPLFKSMIPPYASLGYYDSQVPTAGIWDATVLDGARLVGINPSNQAAILSYHGPNYHATYISTMPEYQGGEADKQFFYNAITYDVLEAVVVRSYESCNSYSTIWDELNASWPSYGSVPIHIRYAVPGLCNGPITYDGLLASQADLLIISDPSGAILQYSPEEISAIQKYASEGHNLIGTYLLFQWDTIDNRGLAPLFGLNASLSYTAAEVIPTYTFLEAGNPLFKHLTAPFASLGFNYSQVPESGSWSAAALKGARLVGINNDQKAAILAYDAPNYRALYITNMPEYNGGAADQQFFYNAIRYTIDAVVVRSWSGCSSNTVIWDSLNATSMQYGSYPVHITYDTYDLCAGTITYEALSASRADVVILSNPSMSHAYSVDEISAIERYALEGHHLVGTLQLLQALGGYDNRGLAPLFGLQAGLDYVVSGELTPAYNFVEAGSPLFKRLADPYLSSGWPTSQMPASGVWDAAAMNGARVVGITANQQAAILSYHGPNYHATFVTTMPEYYGLTQDHQLFYNMLTYDVIDAVLVRSWSACTSMSVIWSDLNATWPAYGLTPIHIRYAVPGLCNGTITYAGLVASQADVLIISDPAGIGIIYTPEEVDAIQRYAQEGHNLIGTYALLQYSSYDNRLIAPVFGLVGTIAWSTVETIPTYNFFEDHNPVFRGLNEPYASSGFNYTQYPTTNPWSAGARLVGMSSDGYAAILVYDAPRYRAIYITTMPEYNGGVQDKQFFYNAIVYRFQTQLPVMKK